MNERQMEDLIAQFPSDLFPGKNLVLRGRQQSFAGVGRFDLLFVDGFQTNILMELKARPAKYEDATQLARYKEELQRLGEQRILMWLVSPLIPRSVREFLDHIGIEYSEIHPAEFKMVAERHGVVFETNDWNRTSDVVSAPLPKPLSPTVENIKVVDEPTHRKSSMTSADVLDACVGLLKGIDPQLDGRIGSKARRR